MKKIIEDRVRLKRILEIFLETYWPDDGKPLRQAIAVCFCTNLQKNMAVLHVDEEFQIEELARVGCAVGEAVDRKACGKIIEDAYQRIDSYIEKRAKGAH